MPAERWWQGDDAVVDLGAVDAGSADLARLLVLDFAISYGGDAYLIPLRVPAASWTTVDSLVVTDSFGGRMSLDPAAGADWAMFTVGPEPGLLPIPRAVGQVAGDPIEELSLARDELANLAWLVEERWEGGLGDPVDRPTAFNAPPPLVPGHNADLAWRLFDDPPPSWVPMLPATDALLGPVLARLPLPDRPTRSVLTGDVASALPDRAVPRSGRRLRRRTHLAHASDGAPSHGSPATPAPPVPAPAPPAFGTTAPIFRLWRTFGGGLSEEDAVAKERKACSSVHLPLEELRFGVHAFGASGVVIEGDHPRQRRGGNRRPRRG